MEHQGARATPDPEGSEASSQEDLVNLGAWFQRGWPSASSNGEKSTEFPGAILDRFREADALGYDNEGDQTDN